MFRYVRSLVVLGMVIIGLLVTSPSAFAGRVHVFGSTFGEEGSGAGQLKEPSAVAVNEVTLANTGDVYVVDTGNNRVEYFSPEGKEPKGAFDGTATPAKSFSSPTAIAIDNSTSPLDPSAGDVYVADSGHDVVDKFTPEGDYLGQIATGAGGASLGEIYGVAVDPNGIVWVDQASKEIDSYSDALANAFLASTESPFEETAPGFAVDSEDHLYVNRGALRFAKLSSTGEILVRSINPEEDATAGAVDFSNNDVYVNEGATIGGFSPTASPLEQFGAGHLFASRGVAVDSTSGVVYAANHETGTVTVFTTVHTPTVLTGEASNFSTEGSATLNGTVDPEGVEVSSCAFEYGPTVSYGSTVACSPAPGGGTGAVSAHADLSGLEVGRYHFRLLASNVNGETAGVDHSFVISGRPILSSEALAGVESRTVRIGAQVSPNGLPTTYQLEYGPSTDYGSNTSPASLGSGFAQSRVQVILGGLRPDTVYHARVVASNERGTVKGGKDIVFTTTTSAGGGEASAPYCPNRTFSGFSSLLPDCRAYEFVSGSGGPGEVYTPVGAEGTERKEDIVTEVPMRAAAAGGGVAYVAEASEAGGSGASGRGLGNQFLAERNDAQRRWEVSSITPQVAEPEVTPHSPVYEAFSSNLSEGVFVSNSASLAAIATPRGPVNCQVLYSHSADGEFHALFTETQKPQECGQSLFVSGFDKQNLLFVGENAGTSAVATGSHLLFQSPAPLTVGAGIAIEKGEGSNLYESVGGTTRLVSVLPGGALDANAVFGGPSSGPNVSSLNRPDFANVISADGSHIFWTDLTTGHLYVRIDGVRTVAVSQGAATFWGASTNERYAFYVEGGALWRFASQAVTGTEREQLVAAGASVQGLAGLSGDGSYVYLVAESALTAGAENRNCRDAQGESEEKRQKHELTPEEAERLDREQGEEERGHLPGGRGCNLYDLHDGKARLVAALSAQDDRLRRQGANGISRLGVWQGELGSRTAQVADDGQELVFESTQQLTGYDNSSLDEALNFEHGVEVFVYKSAQEELLCASCDPSGAPPVPEVNGQGGGTYLPVSLAPTFMRRWVSSDGSRVFFDSSQPFSPQDNNGTQDVYEWERAGTEGCPVGRGGGCISLLSGGDSNDLSFFVDASADGGDVLFTHRGQLGGTGTSDGHTGLFDVRENGGFAVPSLACTGTGCQGVPPVAAGFATPASATFGGVGNFSAPASSGKAIAAKPLSRARLLAGALRACRHKQSKRKRVVCERRARKRYGVARGKKASVRSGKGRE